MTCKTHPDAPHGFVRSASHSEDGYVCECEFWDEPKMNERIKELAEQTLKWPDTDNDGLIVFDNDELEKFTELIVRECAQVAADFVPGYGLEPFSKRFKEHFGVEK